MLPRYSRREMVAVWEEDNKFRIWLAIEIAALEAMVKLGTVPKSALKAVQAKAKFTTPRVHAIERKVKHDVIAFLTNVTEHVGPSARFLHQGMTSSDVLDTCLALQLNQAAAILLRDIKALLTVLKKRARQHRLTPCVGRSHGIHGEPTTFGLKMAQAYAEFSRHLARLESARKDIATCAISGAVGTFAHCDPAVEAYVAKKLKLTPEPLSTQVIPRDRHAFFFGVLAGIAGSVERLAVEIRHLQRTEVREVEEFFSKGQKGSSAMPHKRNPILTENLTGLARLVRAHALPAFENVALWHERDISHSAVERVIGPDATITLDFALVRLCEVMENLVVYPKTMARNMKILGDLIYSQSVLLALVAAGMPRETAYAVVQKHAMTVWRAISAGEKSPPALHGLLSQDKAVAKVLNAQGLAAAFCPKRHFRHVDKIFTRVFGAPRPAKKPAKGSGRKKTSK